MKSLKSQQAQARQKLEKRFWNNGLFDYDDERTVNKHKNVYGEVASLIDTIVRDAYVSGLDKANRMLAYRDPEDRWDDIEEKIQTIINSLSSPDQEQ